MAYAVITHCRLVSEKLSFVWIVGSATLTIETSRTVMKKAAPTKASAFHRLGSSSTWLIASSSGAAGRGRSVPHSKLLGGPSIGGSWGRRKARVPPAERLV